MSGILIVTRVRIADAREESFLGGSRQKNHRERAPSFPPFLPSRYYPSAFLIGPAPRSLPRSAPVGVAATWRDASRDSTIARGRTIELVLVLVLSSSLGKSVLARLLAIRGTGVDAEVPRDEWFPLENPERGREHFSEKDRESLSDGFYFESEEKEEGWFSRRGSKGRMTGGLARRKRRPGIPVGRVLRWEELSSPSANSYADAG